MNDYDFTIEDQAHPENYGLHEQDKVDISELDSTIAGVDFSKELNLLSKLTNLTNS